MLCMRNDTQGASELQVRSSYWNLCLSMFKPVEESGGGTLQHQAPASRGLPKTFILQLIVPI